MAAGGGLGDAVRMSGTQKAAVAALACLQLVACGRKESPRPIARASASLTALAPSPLLAASPKLLSLEVEACFGDLGCPVATQRRRLLEADDRGGTDLVCDRFLEGIGTDKDLGRGRRCLERSLSVYGQKPNVMCGRDVLTLALLAYQGLGGPRDFPLARGLLARCTNDASVQKVRDLGETSPGTTRERALDFCDDAAEKQLDRDSCSALAALRFRTKGTETQKGLGLDAAQRAQLTTLAAYWKEIGELDDQSAASGIVGPARATMIAGREAQSMRRYAALMDLLAAYKPRDPRDTEKLEPKVRARMKALAVLAARESAAEKGGYRALRDVTIEVFLAFHGKTFTKPIVARDVGDRLDEERSREVFGDK